MEYLRQVIIVKIFIWKTETSQKRLSIFLWGWGNTCDRPKRSVRIFVFDYRDRSSLTCQNICGRTLRQIIHCKKNWSENKSLSFFFLSFIYTASRPRFFTFFFSLKNIGHKYLDELNILHVNEDDFFLKRKHNF